MRQQIQVLGFYLAEFLCLVLAVAPGFDFADLGNHDGVHRFCGDVDPDKIIFRLIRHRGSLA